jgi:dihydroorotate dehydrogenase
MLTEIIENNIEGIKVFDKTAKGEMGLDKDKGALNSAGLPNPQNNKILKKLAETQKEHPILSALISIAYYATHLGTARRVSNYLYNFRKNYSTEH